MRKLSSLPVTKKLISEPTPQAFTSVDTINKTIRAHADSACTHFLIRKSDVSGLVLASDAQHSVTLPNGSTIMTQGTALVTIGIGGPTVLAHIHNDNDLVHSLLGIAPLTNQGCVAVFTATDFSVIFADKLLLSGSKEPHDNLWTVDVPLVQPTTASPVAFNSDAAQSPQHSTLVNDIHAQANVAIKHYNDADYALFCSATFGSPADSTLIKALRAGYLGNFPRLTAKMMQENLPNTRYSAKGHLDANRKHPHAPVVPPVTSLIDSSTDDAEVDDDTIGNLLGNTLFTRLEPISADNYSDLTGRLPVTSIHGCQYILISVLSGYIKFTPVISRSSVQYTRAFASVIKFFEDKGRKFHIQHMDNETSASVKELIRTHVGNLQLVPANIHRTNLAERAIRTAKNHFLAMLATADDAFPGRLWEEGIPHAECTLNHLLPWHPNPTISAWEGMHGCKFDFISHPIAPFGTAVLVFETPTQRASWGYHGLDGFFLGPALDHYQTFRTWVTSTDSPRSTTSLAWFPRKFKMPGSSPVEMIINAVSDLAAALTKASASGPIASHSRQLFDTYGHTATAALQGIIDLYTSVADLPSNDSHSPIPGLTSAAVTIPSTHQRVLRSNSTSSAGAPPVPPLVCTAIVPPQAVAPPASQQQPITPPEQAAPLQRVSDVPAEYADTPNTMLRPLAADAPMLRISPPVASYQGGGDRPSANTRSKLPRMYVGSAQQSLPVADVLNLDVHGKPLTFRSAMSGPDAAEWRASLVLEYHRLLTTYSTMKAIRKEQQPTDRRKDTTYFNPQVREKRLADGSLQRRVRGTAGGDRSNYEGPTSTDCAEIAAVKVLLNSVISTGAGWMTVDLVDMYLNHRLDRSEYIRIKIADIPAEIIEHYGLLAFVEDGSVLFQVDGALFGFPQAGRISHLYLVNEVLAPAGYIQDAVVPCIFRHRTNGIVFTLVVDDFGIKYDKGTYPTHLLDTLRTKYQIKVDETGSKYLGMNIDIRRDLGYLSLSIPGYVMKALTRFSPNNTSGALSPSVYTPPVYGSTAPQMTHSDATPPLDQEQRHRLQQIVGVFLYYARMIDSTMLPAITALASEQATATITTAESAARFLAYAASFPANELRFYASGMRLHAQVDASYLSRSGSRSVAGGIWYLGNDVDPTQVNGTVHALSSIIPVIVASAGEAEYGSLFMNMQAGEWLRAICAAVGHPQQATIILCDNECAVGLATNNVKIKRSKSVDMRFHWCRDRVQQGHFKVHWRKGKHNLADFFTKPLPVRAHRAIMPLLVHTPDAVPDAIAISRASRSARHRHAIRI